MNEYPDIERCKKIEKYFGSNVTACYWCEWGTEPSLASYIESCMKVEQLKDEERDTLEITLFKAPSIAEMLEVMPHIIVIPELDGRPEIWQHFFIGRGVLPLVCALFPDEDKKNVTWKVGYDGLKGFNNKSLPNALADTIYWLGENGYIKEVGCE